MPFLLLLTNNFVYTFSLVYTKDYTLSHFVHDKIQYSSYSLDSNCERDFIHLKIGRFLASNNKERSRNLIQIIHHYNLGLKYVSIKEEKTHVLQLNLDAGQAARAQAAWSVYYYCSATAIKLVRGMFADLQYELIMKSYQQAVESARLNNDFIQMQNWINEADNIITNPLDKAIIRKEKLIALIAQNKLSESYETATEINKMIKLRVSFINKFFLIKRIKKPVEYMNSIFRMDLKYASLVLEIDMLIFSVVYLSRPKVIQMLITRMIYITKKYGLIEYMPLNLILFALMKLKGFKRIDAAVRSGQKAIAMIEENPDLISAARTYFIFGGFIQHWKYTLKDSIKTLTKAYQIALSQYNYEFMMLTQNLKLFLKLASGVELDKLNNKFSAYKAMYKEVCYERSYITLIRTFFLIKNLSGKTVDRFSFTCDQYSEQEIAFQFMKAQDFSAIASYYTYKLMIHYYYDDNDKALEMSKEGFRYSSGLLGQFTYVWLIWFTALACIKSLHPKNYLIRIQRILNLKSKLKILAVQCPTSHFHRYQLLKAELYCYSRKINKAIYFYEKSVENAEVNGFIQDQALALECLGRMHINNDNLLSGRHFIRLSYECFKKWGAYRKLEQMRDFYPFLLGEKGHIVFKAGKSEGITNSIDISTILNASKAIAENIDFNSLVHNILEILIQNTGSTKGILCMVDEHNKFQIKAIAKLKRNEISVNINLNMNVLCEKDIPFKLIDYVIKDHILVSSENMTNSNLFFSDPYFEQSKVKSYLCQPLLFMGKIVSCLYLESDFLTGLYQKERIGILNYLSSQIVSSLENARLYESLQTSYNELKIAKDKNQEQFQMLLQAEKLSSLGILAASITHEISNPNYAIYLNSEYLEDSMKDFFCLLEKYEPVFKGLEISHINFEDFKLNAIKSIESIIFCSDQIDKVIKEMKNFIRRGEKEEMKQIEINSVLDSTVTLCRAFIEKATESFSIELANDLPVIYGNTRKLQQVFMNLIINSCQSLSDRSLGIEISSFVNTERNELHVKIKDQGDGIEPDALGKIREPFYSTKSGMGLGLSISEEIVKQHNGKIQYKNNANRGATITVVLPVIVE